MDDDLAEMAVRGTVDESRFHFAVQGV